MRVTGAGGHCLRAYPQGYFQVEAFLISTGLVAVAEIGDKTQLLAVLLAARFRRPVPIILGILIATLANHALAATAGALIGDALQGPWMRWGLGTAFLAFAVWALIPDRLDESTEERPASTALAIFWTTAMVFFLAEMGDKTQVATAALAARFQQIILITAGTTAGMMIANAPAVLLGEALTRRLPLKYIRWGAAGIFALIGIWIMASGD
jgi:putative Ca2+/H+ antiporter (TMEM165/GDT1 family)